MSTLQDSTLASKATARQGLRGVAIICRFAVGLILIVAAVPKIRNPFHFLLEVYKYDLVNAFWGRVIAALVPWFEVIVGSFLIGGWCVGGCLILAAALMATFLIAQGYAIAHHIEATCACFNMDSQVSISYWTLLRDFVIFGAILVAFWLRDTERKPRSGEISSELSGRGKLACASPIDG